MHTTNVKLQGLEDTKVPLYRHFRHTVAVPSAHRATIQGTFLLSIHRPRSTMLHARTDLPWTLLSLKAEATIEDDVYFKSFMPTDDMCEEYICHC